MKPCANCGVSGDFCGYHGLGDKKESLCVACAEAETTVWRIALPDEKGGVICLTLAEAVKELEALVEEMEDWSSYVLHRERMSRLKAKTLPEFTGF